jgi:hypothetical protein
MTNDILIEEAKLRNNEIVPANVLPRRYAIATNILCTIKQGGGLGFLVLNSEPKISNTFYPYYSTVNNFYNFSKVNYGSIVDEFKGDIISKIEKDRISPTMKRFSEYFNCGDISVLNMERNEYWLKYSKSSNVWTIYLFEFFIIKSIENKQGLISRLDVNNILLPIDDRSLEQSLNSGKYQGISIASNILSMLKDPTVISTLKSHAI